MRWTGSRSVVAFTSASSTRRTKFRSLDLKMQQALMVFAGNRILRLGQIERDGAAEEFGEHLSERVWGHVARIIPPAKAGVSDPWTWKIVWFRSSAAQSDYRNLNHDPDAPPLVG